MPVLRRCLLRAALSVVPMAAAAPLAAQQPPAPQARGPGSTSSAARRLSARGSRVRPTSGPRRPACLA
jgi:hypothetical protein